jgi:hypothetical protein
MNRAWRRPQGGNELRTFCELGHATELQRRRSEPTNRPRSDLPLQRVARGLFLCSGVFDDTPGGHEQLHSDVRLTHSDVRLAHSRL